MPQPVPAVPSPPAGWHPVQADFNFWVTDSFSFAAQAPVFRGSRAAAQSLTGGIYNLLDLDTVAEDPYGGWSAVTTASQPAYSWLCPAGCAGWYEASMTGTTASQGSGTGTQTAALIYLNGNLWQYGSDDWAPSGAVAGSSGSVQVPLVPGDYVQFYVFAASSVSTPTAAGELPAIELAWVST